MKDYTAEGMDDQLDEGNEGPGASADSEGTGMDKASADKPRDNARASTLNITGKPLLEMLGDFNEGDEVQLNVTVKSVNDGKIELRVDGIEGSASRGKPSSKPTGKRPAVADDELAARKSFGTAKLGMLESMLADHESRRR